MPWPILRWLFLYCMLIFILKDCECLFLRHVQSGKCIKAGAIVYNTGGYSLPYWAIMTVNCLDVDAQFRYLDSELLYNIGKNGTFVSADANTNYKKHLAIYKAVDPRANTYQNKDIHRLKQTDTGTLYFYNQKKICAEISSTGNKVKGVKSCNGKPEQNFTFGEVTQYYARMESVSCSKIQRMMIQTADYGDYDNSGTFNSNAAIDTTCSILTNCQVKSVCGGNRSCDLTIDDNLLPSQYCSNTSKQIYTKYTCVDQDDYNSKTITEFKVRLSQSPNEGFIEIKDGSTWRKIKEQTRVKHHQIEMLCQHLGFNKTVENNINIKNIGKGNEIATGNLICYKTQLIGTSCCVHLEPSTTSANTTAPYVTCDKICDKPLLKNLPNSTFSGSGGSRDYEQGKFYNNGWCGIGSEYLLIDLQKEYHITRVVTMGDRNQTKWSDSFTLTYNHNQSLVNQKNVQGNQNGYQISITTVDIYNARHIKIESTKEKEFCVRIELCGEVHSPAPIEEINATLSNFSIHLSWTIPEAKVSSYITHFIIYLNSLRIHRISRVKYGNEFVLRGLKPYTEYAIGIQTQDGYLKNSTIVYQIFRTEEAVPNGPPLNVTVNSRTSDSLGISWKAPDKHLWNGKLTGYQVCYSSVIGGNQNCLQTESSALSYNIPNLQSSAKYFVTVAASTKIGYGNKSLVISKITNGEPVNPVPISYSSLNVTLAKQAKYIKEVMVIVQIAPKTPTPVEDIQTNDLRPYQTDTQDPYVAAYFKADVLPFTFIIGDGKENNFKNKIYHNHLLKEGSSYIVFVRFFDTKDSYYSTGWSKSIRTLIKPQGHSGPPLNVNLKSHGKNSLDVSWKVPDEKLQNSELTGYQVCFYTRNATPECLMLQSTKVLSLTLNNLQPSTKYFVTVTANTKAGYGEKSFEVSKITNGEPINLFTTCYYTLSLNVPRQKDYIREVMVIVESSIRSLIPSENLIAQDLKPYQGNSEGPYVTAYLKAAVLPLTFVIGDGKEYNSEEEKYFNQPLQKNTNYIVFLRFLESQSSYYSTEWSSNVTTMVKPSVENVNSQNAKQLNGEKIQMDLLIPLVVAVLCLLLSLGVNIYQRRLIKNNNRQLCHKYKASGQAHQMTEFDSSSNTRRMKDIKASPEDNANEAVYELPDSVKEVIERNQGGLEISTGQESSTYMSLKDNKEPDNVYQSLQQREGNKTRIDYENSAFIFSG